MGLMSSEEGKLDGKGEVWECARKKTSTWLRGFKWTKREGKD